MKTDRFADLIRRKLESIRPEFTEKDWARMQDSLHQADLSQPGSAPTGHPFSGGMWVNKPWLLAAATVSTVALIAISVWQRREITELRQTISHLNQTQTQPMAPGQSALIAPKEVRPEITHSAFGQKPVNQVVISPLATRAEQLPRPDTVYITRYVAAPSRSQPVPPDEQSPGQRSGVPTEQRYAVIERAPVSSAIPKHLKNLNQIQKTDTYDETFTPSSVEKNIDKSSLTTSRLKVIKEKPAINQQAEAGALAPANSGNSPEQTVAGTVLTKSSSSGPQSGESSASYELLNSLTTITRSTNWQAQLTQRAKRMRMIRPMPVIEQVAATAPASQPVQQPPMRFRIGIAGEVESHMWSAGILSEIPLGKRWVLGVGLNQATYLGGTFLTDDDFNTRTHRDFRKEFARGMAPPQDILNIDNRMTRLQIPLTLGYRLPLSRAFTLLPTVGTYLNLTNKEKVTFYYRNLPQRGYDQANYTDNNPVDLIDSFTLSTGLEWQGGHWVIQGHPIVTIPLQNNLIPTPGPRWETATTIGFRARLLYQF